MTVCKVVVKNQVAAYMLREVSKMVENEITASPTWAGIRQNDVEIKADKNTGFFDGSGNKVNVIDMKTDFATFITPKHFVTTDTGLIAGAKDKVIMSFKAMIVKKKLVNAEVFDQMSFVGETEPFETIISYINENIMKIEGKYTEFPAGFFDKAVTPDEFLAACTSIGLTVKSAVSIWKATRKGNNGGDKIYDTLKYIEKLLKVNSLK